MQYRAIQFSVLLYMYNKRVPNYLKDHETTASVAMLLGSAVKVK